PSSASTGVKDRKQHRLEEFSAGGEEPESAVAALLRPPRPPALPGVWRIRDGYVEHPLLRGETLRALPFQLDLARIGLEEDLLVVLPTGLGKTVIGALVGAELLRREVGKILFLAPTRPLVQQHADSFGGWFTHLSRARFTGSVKRPIG
ncbi:MAG: DEAD/DEAH box helicase family protein, partial [Thermoplasmata archaeon]|nr:DEAD/DEAH box helicase family protein [Thermoplasmata archaeon]